MLSPETVLQNRYRIVRLLGQGGMGAVYEALDQRFESRVALKETFFTEEALKKQFEREARLLNRLRHPAMTRVIDHFSENDGNFLVMDYIQGEDLWEMLQKKKGPFPVETVLDWGDQLLDALAYLHQQQPPIIHRDIKPQNLKLCETGKIILLDFGLAKGFADQISRVTPSGSIFGYTPNYAPLEQIQGTGTDPRSDLYALAATLYHLLTGAIPKDVLTRLTATTDAQPDPLRPASEVNPDVPAGVSAVLAKAMAIGLNQRFANAGEMREALRSAPTAVTPGVSKVDAATILMPTVTEVVVRQETSPSPANTARSTSSSPADLARETAAASRATAPVTTGPEPPKKSRGILWGAGGLAALLVAGVLFAVTGTGRRILFGGNRGSAPSIQPNRPFANNPAEGRTPSNISNNTAPATVSPSPTVNTTVDSTATPEMNSRTERSPGRGRKGAEGHRPETHPPVTSPHVATKEKRNSRK